MSTLPTVELGVLGPLQVRQDGAPVGDRVSRVETFDPEQRDLALARFDELNRPA